MEASTPTEGSSSLHERLGGSGSGKEAEAASCAEGKEAAPLLGAGAAAAGPQHTGQHMPSSPYCIIVVVKVVI